MKPDLDVMGRDALRVAKGTIWLTVGGLSTNFMAIVYFIIIALLIPNLSELGILTFVTLINQIVVVAISFQIPRASVMFISRSMASGNVQSTNGLVVRLLGVGILCSMLAASALLVLGTPLSYIAFGSSVAAPYLQMLALDAALIILSQFLNQSFLGIQSYRVASLTDTFQKVARYGMAIVMFIGGHGVAGIISGWAMGDCAGVVVGTIIASRLFAKRSKTNTKLSEVVGFACPLVITRTMEYFSQTSEHYLLLILAGSAQLGIYSPVVTAANMVSIVPLMVTSTLFPHFAKRATKPDYSQDAFERGASRWILLAFVPAAFGLASISLPLITLTLGERYIPATGAMMISAIALGATASSAVINAKLLGQGRGSVLAISSMLSILGGVLVSIMLIPHLGVIGAAIAHSVVLAVQLAVTASFLWRKGELHVDRSMIGHSLAGSTIMVLAVILTQRVFYSASLLLVYMTIGVVSYLVYLRVSKALESSDFSFAIALSPKHLAGVICIAERMLIGQRAEPSSSK